MRIFIDSDVVISSLISSISLKELRAVVEMLVKNRFEVFPLTKELGEIKEEYVQYVTDINDAHIVAGAYSTKVKYLISYNLKHFKKDKMKNELGLILLTPALFLQYLRSQ